MPCTTVQQGHAKLLFCVLCQEMPTLSKLLFCVEDLSTHVKLLSRHSCRW